jgi:DNA sulfur modification protein DndC
MNFCSNCLVHQSPLDERAMAAIKAEYKENDKPWFIGYSGGKDSSAVLKLVFNSLAELNSFHKPVKVVYCDTGVEIPTISKYVKRTIRKIRIESEQKRLPFEFVTAKPKLDDRYFVKVIGRGYPPPTNIFRWCTDRLRINPVEKITGNNPDAIILLGVRRGESQKRDRTINKYTTAEKCFLASKGSRGRIFSPIIDHTTRDVWSTLKHLPLPNSIDHTIIGQIYKDAGAECPVVRDSKGTPCGKGRFGCWTCTVVREDRSVAALVESGYTGLDHLFKFRNWLAKFRDNPRYRCHQRRNGREGLGPLTLKGREKILSELLKTERQSGLRLIEASEIKRIKELWQVDRLNPNYRDY